MSSQANSITPLDIAPEKVISFPKGLPGFETSRRFGLYNQDSESILFSLQSLDDPDVAFTVADPAVFGFRYDMPLNDDDTATLSLAEGDDVAVAVIVYKNEQGGINANLTAPLLINLNKQTGLQRPMTSLSLDVTLRGA